MDLLQVNEKEKPRGKALWVLDASDELVVAIPTAELAGRSS